MMMVVVGSAPENQRAAVLVFSKHLAAAGNAELALTRSLTESGVELIDLAAQFPRIAAPNPSTVMIQEGYTALDDLDTDVAGKKFAAALVLLEAHPALAQTEVLAELNVLLGSIAMQNGAAGKVKAAEAFTRAVVYDPTYTLDVRKLGTDVKKEWAKAATAVEAKPPGTLTVTCEAGASVIFQKVTVGPTPAKTTAAPGRHLVQITRAGYELGAMLVEVESRKDTTAALELVPVPAYQAQRLKVHEAMTTSGPFPSSVREAALTLNARFLVVSQVDVTGIGEVETWDTATNERSKRLPIRDVTAVSTETKRFIAASGRPVAASGDGTTTSSVSASSSGVTESRPLGPLTSLRGAKTLGQGLAVRAQVSAGTSSALNTNVLGFEAAASLALKPRLDLVGQVRVPLTAGGVAPGVSLRYLLAEDGRLAFAVVGSVDLPIGFSRGTTVGLSVTPGLLASYLLSEKAEAFGGVLASYNHLFWSNPRLAGTGQPGLMVGVRGGLSYALFESVAAYANVDVAGGYAPQRKTITIGNAGTGIAMTASVSVGAQLRLR